MTTLADARLSHSVYRVVSIQEEPIEIRAGLNGLGIFPGVELKVLRSFWGHIMQIKVGTTSISIRKREAEFITVEKKQAKIGENYEQGR